MDNRDTVCRNILIGIFFSFLILGLGIFEAQAQVVFSEDFDPCPGDWTFGDDWECGTPTNVGPSTCKSGSECAATILDGNYSAINSSLISPSIVLPDIDAAAGEELHLSFWHWFSFAGDRGQVYVQEETSPGVWGTWNLLPNSTMYGVAGGVWTNVKLDLSAFAGKKIKFQFYLEWLGLSTAEGWYIDDVEITVGQTYSVPYVDDFESGLGDWWVYNGMWQVGTPTNVGPSTCKSGSECAATILDGNYPENDASLISPSIVLPDIDAAAGEELHLSFWHWFSFAGDRVRVYVQEETSPGVWGTWNLLPDSTMYGVAGGVWTNVKLDLSAFAGKKIKFQLNLDWLGLSTAEGWYIDDVEITVGQTYSVPYVDDFESGLGDWWVYNGMWQVGTPTNVGPSTCKSGSECAATILDGNYPDNDASLISPSIVLPDIDAAAGEELHLSFWHWFSFAGDQGQVYVKEETSPGVWGTWNLLPDSTMYGVAGGVWTNVKLDLSAFAGKKIKVQFNLDWLGLSTAEGRYIDDVEITVGQTYSVPYVDDFESGLGDWWVYNGMWQVGTPTNVGPSTCKSGSECAATILDGNYPENDASLISPSIVLPNIDAAAGEELHLSFWHWFSFAGDQGQVYVKEETSPGVWGTWNLLPGSTISGTSGGVWVEGPPNLDLSSYAGKKIKVQFNLDWLGLSTAEGWYIDDVRIANNISPFYCDKDNDGHRNMQVDGYCSGDNCAPQGCDLNPGDDCDDRPNGADGIEGNADDGVNIYPGALEVCNGLDDNCDDTVDETSNTLCDNGLYCDGQETCGGSSGCQGGTPVDCNDGVSCTIDNCDEDIDACMYTPNDGLCDNGQFCDGAETCDPVNDCQAGTPVDCNDGVSCTVDSCNEGTDSCDNLPNDGLCDNGQFCDGAETCDPVNDCQATPPCDPATQNCDEGNDICVPLPTGCAAQPDPDAFCDDGNFCNGAETCNLGTGDCQAGTPVDCNDGVSCTVDSCNEGTDSCDNLPNDGLCDNGQFCDGAETCDPVNDCQATPPCDPATQNCDEGNDICVPLPTGCAAQPDPDAFCDDGNFCNGAETCNLGTGDCQAGTPVDCNDGVSCTVDSCNEGTDSCDNLPNDGLCDNGQFCDGAETCDPVNDCQATPPCDPATQNCDEGNDICVPLPTGCAAQPDPDAFCDDGNFCNGAETCNLGTGDCQAGTPVDCNDGVSCTVDSCNEGTDSCDNLPNDGLCDNGQFCDGAETCDPVNDCQAGVNPCAPGDSCDEANDTCEAPPVCFPGETQSCITGLMGVCTSGTQTCGADEFWGDCVQDIQPSDEVCNDGLDNDCDGITDELPECSRHIDVLIDIKPGSYPNSINLLRKGVIPVAVLTSSEFDVTTIRPSSVKFGPGEATEVHGKGHIKDVDGDGDIDLILHFDTQGSEIACEDTEASLTGKTYYGQDVMGFDSVNIVRCE